jgi:mannose-6-phosphate isomerase-like protein (cupin superfamily)
MSAFDGVAEAPAFIDANGSLHVFDVDLLPFCAARFFFVCAPVGALRGKHAHHVGRQFLAVVAGHVKVVMTDLSGNATAFNLRVGQGLYLPPQVWATQEFVEPNSVLLVLCDLPYDEEDYIRDEREFLALKKDTSHA